MAELKRGRCGHLPPTELRRYFDDRAKKNKQSEDQNKEEDKNEEEAQNTD